jgi:protein subunit release factor A
MISFEGLVMRLRDEDLSVEHLRRSGPGGQHRNRRSTGIRLLHIPTGIVVMATERRSQAQNLAEAIGRLLAVLEKRFRKPKPRVKTSATRSSREKRLREKKARSRTKDLRRPKIELD